MKRRLDILLVERGLAHTRQRAQGIILSGEVSVNGKVITKAGHQVAVDAEITIERKKIPFVSRGGLKLDAALSHFGIDLDGKIALDVGASTGGFTDCLIKRGVKKVYAVDVGYGLIDSSLRNDPRVVLIERTNFRYIEKEVIPECIDIVTIDVSFISSTKIIPKAVEFLCENAEILILVKPQFEVGKGQVGKGGIVKDESQRKGAVESVEKAAEESNLVPKGVFECPVKGQKGNIEYFLYARKV